MTTAEKTRKKSWASGMDLVKAGLMTMDALHKGVEDGVFSPDPNGRDYGADTDLYIEAENFLNSLNQRAVGFDFTVVGRKRLTDAEKAARKAARKPRTTKTKK